MELWAPAGGGAEGTTGRRAAAAMGGTVGLVTGTCGRGARRATGGLSCRRRSWLCRWRWHAWRRSCAVPQGGRAGGPRAHRPPSAVRPRPGGWPSLPRPCPANSPGPATRHRPAWPAAGPGGGASARPGSRPGALHAIRTHGPQTGTGAGAWPAPLLGGTASPLRHPRASLPTSCAKL